MSYKCCVRKLNVYKALLIITLLVITDTFLFVFHYFKLLNGLIHHEKKKAGKKKHVPFHHCEIFELLPWNVGFCS